MKKQTLAIIEYKKESSYSVIDQGLSYLALLLNNKEVFRLRYSEKINAIKRDEEIDWSQSRVIFISPSFSIYQKGAIEFKDLPIELWQVERYDNDTIALNPIKPLEKRESIKTIGKRSKSLGKLSRQIREYTEEEKMIRCNQHTKDLYYELRDRIKEIGNDIVVSPKRNYVALKRNTANIARLIPMSLGIRVRINTDKFKIDDAKSIMTANKRGPKIDLKQNIEIPYVLDLVKQVYEQA